MLSSSSSPGPGWTVPNGFIGGRGGDATRLRAIGPFGGSNYGNGGAVWLGREGAFEICCDDAINENKARYFILPPTVPHIFRQRRQHGCRTFSPPISPSYSPSSPLAGEEVPHPQPGGWDLWYHIPSQGGLGNEVPHPQPGALGVGGTTSPARGPACEVLFPPLGQLWTTWRSKGKIAHTQFYEKENPEIQTKFCIY